MSSNLDIIYKEKYAKYKQKYLDLKQTSEIENKTSEISDLIGGSIKGKEIYLVRHGETDWNVKGFCQGSRNDIPLNKLGKEQAIKTGKYLSEYRQKDDKFDLVLCSPLIRTRETCELICNKIGYDINKIKYMEELKENDKGLVCIGKSHNELKKDKFYDDYFNTRDNIYKIKDPIEKTLNYEKIMKTVEKKYEIEKEENLKKRINKIINFIKKTNKKKNTYSNSRRLYIIFFTIFI